MGLDIFFLKDIRNALLAADEASSGTVEVVTNQNARTLDLIAEKLREELPENSRPLLAALHTAAVGNMDAMRHYRQGYKAALTTVALAFGIRYTPHQTTPTQTATVLDLPVQEWREG